MGPPQPAKGIISIEACARPIAVDHRISLPYYFRIAGTLLRQAKIYRDEKNILDLYVILLRYTSLLCETIPKHRDYPVFKSREPEFVRNANSSTLIDVVNELESLKPVVKQQIFEHNRRGTPEANGLNGTYAANHRTEKNSPSTYSTQPFVGNNNGSLQKFSPDGRHHMAPLPSVQTDRQIRKQYVYLLFTFMSMICCVLFCLATNYEGQAGARTGVECVQEPQNTPIPEETPDVPPKRQRTWDAILCMMGQMKMSFDDALRTTEPLPMPKVTPPTEILEALKKIPDLEATDMLRAYGKLIVNERLFEALMALPEDFRKPWLLTLE